MSAPQSRVALAADIGATSMRAALVREDGHILVRTAVPTLPARGIEDATERLAAALDAIRPAGDVTPVALGVSTAGPVDPASGIYSHAPNLPGWHGRSMQSALEDTLGLPVRVGHDATLAAFGETEFGTHRGARDLVYLTVSSGIGAGIVSGGRMVTGSHGGAGEAGHIIVEPGGPSCGAGCGGCLEAVASGLGIAAEVQRRIDAGATTSMSPGASAVEVVQAARDGDPLACDILDHAIGFLAAGIASLLAILDPQVLVVGGGFAEGLAWRWDDLLRATRARALPRYRDALPVERTTLGDNASLLGAAALALGRDTLDGMSRGT